MHFFEAIGELLGQIFCGFWNRESKPKEVRIVVVREQDHRPSTSSTLGGFWF